MAPRPLNHDHVQTFCKRVQGCVHPPNHLGVCEVNGVTPRQLDEAESFLSQQERTARLASRLNDELLIIVGANTVLLEGGLTRDALVLLVTAKCKRTANGARIAETTVELVLEAIGRLPEYLGAGQVPVRQAEEEGPRRKRR